MFDHPDARFSGRNAYFFIRGGTPERIRNTIHCLYPPAAGSGERAIRGDDPARRYQGLLRMGEKDVISADIDDALILPPEKRPVLLVLQKIGFEQEHAGDDPAGDEGVIRPVDAIGHLLRAGADPRHKGEVGIGMAAEDIVQPFENLLPAYQLWKRPVQEIVGRGPGDDLTVAGPAARADGNAIGILPGELLQRSSRVPLLRPSDS